MKQAHASWPSQFRPAVNPRLRYCTIFDVARILAALSLFRCDTAMICVLIENFLRMHVTTATHTKSVDRTWCSPLDFRCPLGLPKQCGRSRQTCALATMSSKTTIATYFLVTCLGGSRVVRCCHRVGELGVVEVGVVKERLSRTKIRTARGPWISTKTRTV